MIAAGIERKVYEGHEHGEIDVPVEVLLENGKLRLYPEIVQHGVFKIYPRKDQLVFQAAGYIGLIPINDRVTIDVRSRVPNRNLDRVLTVSGHVPIDLSPHSRDFKGRPIQSDSLLDSFAMALLGSLELVRVDGRLKQYVQERHSTSFPRGRILFDASVKSNFARGITHRVEVARFEYSSDNSVNRCIKLALLHLASRYIGLTNHRGRARMLSRLNSALHYFGNVGIDHKKRFLLDQFVRRPSLIPYRRVYYRDAVKVAKAVLAERGASFDQSGSEFRLGSLLLKMDDAFERYIRNTLARNIGNAVDVLDGNVSGKGGAKKKLFDVDSGIYEDSATPDIVIQRKEGEQGNPLVVDVKYKSVAHAAKREDIEQVIAYALSFQSRRALLVYPRTENGLSGLSAVGKIKDRDVYQYNFDLYNGDIEAEEAKLSSTVLSLLVPSGVH
jgi:5-methylcytosine-specific restriction enzyme subunit McrC